MKSSAGNIKLRPYDEIIKSNEERTDANVEKIINLSIEKLNDFSNHPFKVNKDESMNEMVKSIKTYGVLVPALARPIEDGIYELISGHRRKLASLLAGKESMPTIIREMSDEEAVIVMVDSNMQRENLLPSEKAFAYKMKLDAIKSQGKRTDLTSSQVGTKLRSDEILSENSGDSRNQIQRYIRLTYLIKPILDLVDQKHIALNPAVEISYLSDKSQGNLFETISREEVTPSLSQAQRLKNFEKEGKLSIDVILAILTEEKPQQNTLKLQSGKLSKYFPKETTPKEMEETILKLLDAWHRKRQQENER